jgi:SEC-C motif-containing protein
MYESVIITGCDSSYFLLACLLEHSLKRSGFSGKFWVLDFGLAENEKAFLARKGVLIEYPEKPLPKMHPVVLKTKLSDYLSHLDRTATYVWMDCDILVAKSFPGELENLLAGMDERGSRLAASPEVKVQDILSNYPDLNVEPFRKKVADLSIPMQSDYLNAGFIIFRSFEFMERWKALAEEIPFHAIYDQNIFNLLAHGEPNVTKLPRLLWNFHGEDLCDMNGASPHVLHLTAADPAHLQIYTCFIKGQPNSVYQLRMTNSRDFRESMFELVSSFFQSESGGLKAAGLLPEQVQASSDVLAWNVSRNAACPCWSGEKFKHCHGRL